MTERNASFIARVMEARRRRKAAKGPSPEKLAEHHEPKRGWMERASASAPGGQRHMDFKGDK